MIKLLLLHSVVASHDQCNYTKDFMFIYWLDEGVNSAIDLQGFHAGAVVMKGAHIILTLLPAGRMVSRGSMQEL